MKKRNLLQLVVLAGIALWAGMDPSTADAGSVVYVAGANNEFGTLNLATGTFTQIGTLNLSPSGDNIFGMGFASNGNLYGLDSQTPASTGSSAHLWQINISNAAVTDLGAVSQTAVGATTDAAGRMYALSRDANAILYTLNPPATTTFLVGPTGVTSMGLMAVNANGTKIYTTVLDPTTGNSDLYSINPTTGVATLIGGTSFVIISGLFVNGTLYGFDDSKDAIVSINTTTGAGTQVATYNLPNGDSVLASAAMIPEPSSVVLGLIAVVTGGALGLLRRRPPTPAA